MKIVKDHPPIYGLIVEAFPDAARPGVIFCWGDTIFNPSGNPVSPELRAHEAVHSKRQGNDIEGWWRRYIADPEFRLAEELPAHRREYWTFCRRHGNRNQRGAFLDSAAGRLSGPLYGGVLSPEKAKAAILTGAA